jgi:hypothetical protein
MNDGLMMMDPSDSFVRLGHAEHGTLTCTRTARNYEGKLFLYTNTS